jgi:opacity protein-like surface antigen
MSTFAVRPGLALALAAISLGGRMAHAQTAPLQYWVPGWPVDSAGGQGLDSYGNFPSFDGSGTKDGFFSRRYSFSNSWSSLAGGPGLNLQSTNPYASFGPLTTEGSQFGYKFKSGVSLYGGFDTLKVDRGNGAFAAFDASSGTLPVYRANAGIEFQPAPNVSLSLGFSYTQQQSDRIDSDINSPLVPGATPSAFTSGRR